jgi:hypothetical protein
MPLTAKGEKIKSAMVAEYGAEKGEQVFYASKNAGKISGVDEMNGGVEGLKSYGDSESCDDSHHHEFKGKTGPEIEDRKHEDSGMGLVQNKEEPHAAAAEYPKPMDAGPAIMKNHEFPNDPFGDSNPDGGFDYKRVWSASEMKDSPFAIYKE